MKVFERTANLDKAYATPSLYPGIDLAQLGIPLFVRALGMESGSMIRIRRMLAAFFLKAATTTSMYSFLYLARPAAPAGSSPFEEEAAQSRPIQIPHLVFEYEII
jgi:hypothetical protein